MTDQDFKKLINDARLWTNYPDKYPTHPPLERAEAESQLMITRQMLNQLAAALEQCVAEKNKWQDNYDGALSDLSHVRYGHDQQRSGLRS